MDLPPHVAVALGLPSPLTKGDLEHGVDAGSFVQDVFGLSGLEFADAIEAESLAPVDFFTKLAPRSPQSWRSFEILNDSKTECIAICTCQPTAGLPPTAIGQVLARCWLSESTIVNLGQLVPNIIVRAITRGVAHAQFLQRISQEWADNCPQAELLTPVPTWVVCNQLDLRTASRLTESLKVGNRFGNLLIEAISEVKPKWRFLSLYRIIEHGYLSEVLNTLEQSFFASPKTAVNAAMQSLESELNQCIAVAEASVPLQGAFDMFYFDWEISSQAGNQFAIALERSAKNEQKQFRESWKRGIVYFYKTRCAIVHAGSQALIFESYPQGPAFLEAVLPACELIALEFLGVDGRG